MTRKSNFRNLIFISFVFAIILLSCSPAFTATLRVPTVDYPTIQSAIDAASHLDTVLVADGTYRGGGNKNLDFNGKAITLKSENGPANCIIDCDGDGRGFYFDSGEGAASEVSGFTITDGSEYSGGGIYFGGASPTITNCIISGNAASSGGGIYLGSFTYSYPTFVNCTILSNTSSSSGAGIHFASHTGGTFTNCTINSNTASTYGGGINFDDSVDATFTDCTISSNFAASHGGGVYCNSSLATFSGCTISNNRANDVGSDGGGIYLSDSATITNCLITGNTAYDNGGGIYCNGSPTITNCTFSGNTVTSAGGGLYCYGSSSSPKIWNTIFWGDTPNEIYVNSGSPEVHYSDVQGGYSGTGNIDSDPLFVGNGNYHLTSTASASPCINTGSNIAPELPSEDKDGNSRTIDGIADMGAYDYEKLAPTVSTTSASSVTTSTAVLNGTTNPNGAITTYCFQYGTTTGYGSTTAHTNVGAGKSNVSVSLSKSGLGPNTTYHFRIAARNFAGTSYGNDRAFTTPFASVIYVNKNDGTCGGHNPCYTSIQAGINAANTGSAVRIAQGTYTESIVLNASKSLTLKGGWDSSFGSQTSNKTFIKAPKAPVE